MGIFAKLRERIPFIKFLVNAQKTVWYPALFALLCTVSGTHGSNVYVPIMWVLIAMHLFTVLFTDDNKVFLTQLCMIYFAIGSDGRADEFYLTEGDLLSYMSDYALGHMVAMGIIGVGSFLVRLMLDGSIKRALTKRRFFTWGIIAADAAFILNGILSPTYDSSNLGFGALLAMGFTVIYFLVSGMLDTSEDPFTYGCYVMLATAYSALAQVLTVVYRLDLIDKYILNINGNLLFNKEKITLGWGVSTVIAAVFVLGIPAAMYLAKNRRGSLVSFASCFIFILGTVVINVRSAMAVGVFAFLVCAAICCIRGKNRVAIRIYSAVSLVLILGAAIYVICTDIISMEKVFDILRIEDWSDSGRGKLWQNGLEDFKSSPVFGAGFADGAYPIEEKKNNIYSGMYHCIFVQIPAAMGIFGCIAMLPHFAQLCVMLFKKFSTNKLILMLVPLMILAMSLLDNFFFYLDFQILYAVFLALAEKYASDHEKGTTSPKLFLFCSFLSSFTYKTG